MPRDTSIILNISALTAMFGAYVPRGITEKFCNDEEHKGLEQGPSGVQIKLPEKAEVS